jgi:hypothetical protein
MKSDSGFLNTRHDTESGDTSAASPAGRKKSAENWSPRSNSARVAASKPLRTGQGRTIGVVTVAKLFICFARVSLRVHLRAIAAKSSGSPQGRARLHGRPSPRIETEAAPIRYVGELVGADTDNERAIRWLIALMVLCCDPLAIALTAAASARRSTTV